jgi:hypothetical protein
VKSIASMRTLVDQLSKSTSRADKALAASYLGIVASCVKSPANVARGFVAAAGSVLWHHVVDTMDDAVALTKRFNAAGLYGTPRFICLEELDQRADRNMPSDDELDMHGVRETCLIFWRCKRTA